VGGRRGGTGTSAGLVGVEVSLTVEQLRLHVLDGGVEQGLLLLCGWWPRRLASCRGL
jgi:hypothetical protein